jgi:hypothetical protein
MASRSYFEDVERIKREVLLLASRAMPRVIIDVGVGESTRDILSKGMGVVVAVDVDCSRLKDLYRDVDPSSSGGVLMPVCCDVVRLPLRRGSADLAVLYFVLHEIDPRLHPSVLTVLKGVSRHVLIAEPTPRARAYKKRHLIAHDRLIIYSTETQGLTTSWMRGMTGSTTGSREDGRKKLKYLRALMYLPSAAEPKTIA